MRGRIFISCSSKDAQAALTICNALEARGYNCWLASRDVGPGQNFQEEIVRAIGTAPLMILVFSANANNSNEIKKELALASQKELVVVPVRIEDVAPSGAFVYELATRQWIDIFGDWERAMQRLLSHIALALGESIANQASITMPAAIQAKNGKSFARRYMLYALGVITLTALIVVWGVLSRQLSPRSLAPRKEAVVTQKSVSSQFFDPSVAFVTGPPDAKTSLVEFYDYACHYCRASLPAVKRFYAAHKNDTRFSFIDVHTVSEDINTWWASLQAQKQPAHFMDFHFALLSHEGTMTESMIYAEASKAGLDVDKLKADMANPEMNNTLPARNELAQKAGVSGTPTFFMNGRIFEGALNYDHLAQGMKN